ncbi:GTP-dependent dephospho-CoA kinase family protein [Salinarchaeum laminariae]|uniref:GTP-dependent dephospho-CoA kinase family protein n=1 Tax=Salinarchaeum laminariae TaxID=869888 RepID=UPI0020BD9D62|nr:GTP-dependent dephospho-CoA kinase family protein [Salinarchaeum laminariae]
MAGADDGTDEPDVVLELPEAARGEFKDPFGPVFTDVSALRAEHDGPFVTVGDIVTYHFEEAGHQPALALVDGRTKRETAPDSVRDRLDAFPNQVAVTNPPGVITADLLTTIAAALDRDGPTTLVVDGEEDLATVPVVLAAPLGATVVYGQPDEGMVAVDVTEEHRERFRDLLSVFDGDLDRALSLLEA